MNECWNCGRLIRGGHYCSDRCRAEDNKECCENSQEPWQHQPDLARITPDPEEPARVLAVACRHCGSSGSFTLEDVEVEW